MQERRQRRAKGKAKSIERNSRGLKEISPDSHFTRLAPLVRSHTKKIRKRAAHKSEQFSSGVLRWCEEKNEDSCLLFKDVFLHLHGKSHFAKATHIGGADST